MDCTENEVPNNFSFPRKRLYRVVTEQRQGIHTQSQRQSQSYFTTDGLPPISSWRQPPWDSRPTFFFQLNSCSYSPYVTSSLTRGKVCRLQLLLSLASADPIRGPNPAGLMTKFDCLRFETHPTWRARSPYLYPPGTGWPNYTPRHWVPFSSPPTTRRATVEVWTRLHTG
jgi:hypothetical protein